MEEKMISAQVKIQTALLRAKEERGEIGSWLILAAALAIAAGIVGGWLAGWIETKATSITSQ